MVVPLKDSPAVPPVTVASLSIVSVWAPMESVPRVCVTPVPLVSRSDLMMVLAVTVVLRPKFNPVSLANSRIPPPRETVPVVLPASALALVVARRVPPESVVEMIVALAPLSVRVPLPSFAILKSLPPVMMPSTVTWPSPPKYKSLVADPVSLIAPEIVKVPETELTR